MEELHICLWGEQNFKNYTPTIVPDQQATLLVLGESEQASIIKSSLANHGTPPLFLDWPVVAQATDFTRLEAFIAEQPLTNIVLNLSSGERLSAMQLFHWASLHHFECYLIDEEDQQHWLPPSPQASRAIPDLASLKAYFRIHQIQLLKHGLEFPITNELRHLVDNWVARSNQYPLFRALNWLASSAQPSSDISNQEFIAQLDRHWQNDRLSPLLRDLQQHSLLSCDKRQVTFIHEASRAFCNGGWLELFVYERIRRLKAQLPELQDVRLGLEVAYPEGAKNELDVVFLANNQLYLIEVKTSYLANKVEAANQILYKLDALSHALGVDVKGMVISLFDLPYSSQTRAGIFDLEIVSGAQIKQLNQRLKDWITLDDH